MVAAIPANQIALINANTTPLPGFARDGVTAIAYNQVPYNGANIQAANVPPPEWLNIDSQIVNRLATERDARAAVAAGQRANPILVNPIDLVVAPVSVVDPATIAVGGVNLQLPTIAPAGGLPLPPGTLQALLGDGEWGNAFIGLVQDIRTPIQITTASIDSIFKWGAGVSMVVPPGAMSCKASYVQAMADLLQLPSGIRLFRDIIIAHHCCPYLPKMRFRSALDESKFSPRYNNENLCAINLEWDNTTHTHAGGAYVCIATRNNLQAPAGNYPGRGRRMDFVEVNVPPSLVLAHELNHYLRTLIACKSIMDQKVDIVSRGILDPFSPGANIGQHKAIKSAIDKVIDIYHEIEHKNILRKILPNLPVTPAEKMFNDLWNIGNLHEMVNILPTANILGRDASYGGSSYSDGAILGEALRTHIRPQLVFTRSGDPVNLATIPFNVEGFVRLGHCRPISFWRGLRSLHNNRDEFKDLVQKLLDMITVNGVTLWAGNNNLPSF
jgi:hypothetical protein